MFSDNYTTPSWAYLFTILLIPIFGFYSNLKYNKMAEYKSVNQLKQEAMQKAWEINLAKSEMSPEDKLKFIPTNPITYVGVKLKMDLDEDLEMKFQYQQKPKSQPLRKQRLFQSSLLNKL